jgi:hypothetical protein
MIQGLVVKDDGSIATIPNVQLGMMNAFQVRIQNQSNGGVSHIPTNIQLRIVFKGSVDSYQYAHFFTSPLVDQGS